MPALIGDPEPVKELLAHLDDRGDHLTILRFTTGWKVAWGTPDLDTGQGRDQVGSLPSFPTLEGALKNLLGPSLDG